MIINFQSCSSQMETAMSILSSHNYTFLQYHLEYKRSATKFPRHFKLLFTNVYSSLTVSGEPYNGGVQTLPMQKLIRDYVRPLFLVHRMHIIQYSSTA